jgi:hypothetical protein
MGKTDMKVVEIRMAKAALLDKSLLGYRKSADGSRGSERTSEAKVGNVKLDGSESRLVRTTDAKVGASKIRA